MISRAQYQYIKDVLGVDSVIVPEGFVQPPQAAHGSSVTGLDQVFSTALNQDVRQPVQVIHSTNSEVAIAVGRALSPVEKQLARKILFAVQVDDPNLIQISEINSEVIQNIAEQTSARWLIYFAEHFEKFYGTIETINETQILYTYPLDSMLNGPSSEIQNFKKQVWQHVQALAARWKGKKHD